MNKALVLVAIQNDYFPGGRMELEGAEAAAQNGARLLAAFRARGWPLVHIQHVSVRPNATFFLPGTSGVDIHPAVGRAPASRCCRSTFRTASAPPRLTRSCVRPASPSSCSPA